MERLALAARNGDGEALEKLIRGLQDRIFGLALRMLGNVADAEDACQEILIKIITHLGQYQQKSAFTTWIHRIALNHLFATLRQGARQNNFTDYAEDIDRGLTSDVFTDLSDMETNLLAEEMMVSCTQGMLLCLNSHQRAAYILGDILHLTGKQSAAILGITPETFRQRLSRSKKNLCDFMRHKCSLLNPANACTCEKQASSSLQSHAGKAQPLEFINASCKFRHLPEVKKRLAELEEIKRMAFVFRSHPQYRTSEALKAKIEKMILKADLELVHGGR